MRRHTKSAAQRFSPTDRRRLERALSAAREARLYRRIEAVLLVAEGQPISDAAQRVRATRLSVRRWVERYLAAHDAAALADRPRRGRPHSAPRLTPCRLAAALARDPRGCGYQEGIASVVTQTTRSSNLLRTPGSCGRRGAIRSGAAQLAVHG